MVVADLAVASRDCVSWLGGVMAVPVGPAAFMSYVRFNDAHDDGQLSQFRERLAAEVRAQTGEEFAIFQDRNDIAWGQSWQQRIDEALDAVTLLLVIITPSLFRSPPCRAEFQRFVDRERALGRADLILPVYYIGALEMDDPGLRESDEMAKVLASRQLADWRELRFEPFTSPLVRRSLAQLASRMRDTFWQPPATPRPAGGVRAAESSAGTAGQAGVTGQVTAKTEPPTHVVDPFPGRGDFTTVGAAITVAKPGDRILVRPGVYDEALMVDKPLEILGDGPVPDIEIRARGANVLLFQATIGRVANLTLRQAGGKGLWYGVDISQGRLDLEGCDISSQSTACVAIRNGADPRLRRNKIHDGKSSGVFVLDDGLGTLEDNDITGNALSGVEIKTGGSPTLRRNQIHDNKAGVLVSSSGLGTLEDNDISGNAFSGVQIKTGGNPTLRRNQIHDNKSGGFLVSSSGLGTLEDNDITSNVHMGVEIREGSNPTLRGNRINRNGYQAVWIHQGGRGVVEDNDLTGNKRGAWLIAEDCKANVTRARNKE
jgi:parallel beta-helix repeat protein